MPYSARNIRPNLAGDFPRVHPGALIDPSAQIIGNVQIAKDVFVGPLATVRADKKGSDGLVQPIIIEEEASIQDGAILHSHGGSSVVIGPKTTVAQGVVIHGPCTIGAKCLLALRCAIYRATIEDSVWVGMGALVMRATLESHLHVPAGSVITGRSDLIGLRFVSAKETDYMDRILESNSRLRKDYQQMYGQLKKK